MKQWGTIQLTQFNRAILSLIHPVLTYHHCVCSSQNNNVCFKECSSQITNYEYVLSNVLTSGLLTLQHLWEQTPVFWASNYKYFISRCFPHTVGQISEVLWNMLKINISLVQRAQMGWLYFTVKTKLYLKGYLKKKKKNCTACLFSMKFWWVFLQVTWNIYFVLFSKII